MQILNQSLLGRRRIKQLQTSVADFSGISKMYSSPEISPPPKRTYPFVYEAWRQTRTEPNSKRREHSAECQVPRQVNTKSVIDRRSSSSSGRTDKHAGSEQRRPGCAHAGADGRRSRMETTYAPQYKNNKPSPHKQSSINQDSVMSGDNDVTAPTYSKSCHRDEHLLQSLIKAVKDINLTTAETCSMLNMIPEFDPVVKGQSVDSWSKKVEDCRDICNWSDKQTTYFAILKLSGAAKTWYLGLPTVIFTWKELKGKLTEVFPGTHNYAELLVDMLSATVYPGESLELYYHQKMQLLHRCNISGKEAVDCLVHGMRDKVLRVAAQAAQFAEPEQVLKFFKSVK